MNAKKYEVHCTPCKSPFRSEKIGNPGDAAKYARQFYQDDINIYESMFILLLNKAGKVIGWAKLSQGGIDTTVMDSKIICKYVVDTLASGAILIHNHPSGNIKPSKADKESTDRISKALRFFDTQLLDHIILSEDSFFSFTDEGII